MNIEIIDTENYFTWRETLWDRSVFGKKTLEILEIVYDCPILLKQIFQKINYLIETNCIELIFLRFSSCNQDFKREAMLNGFQIVEHSYYLEHLNISKISKSSRRLNFRKPNEEDVSEIIKVVNSSFDFGRFHEDPLVPIELSKKRYENWIPQLISGTNFYVLELKNEVAGFFNYIKKDLIIDLPLSGLSNKYSGFGGFMWKEMLNFIDQEEEIKKVKVMISASNLPVLNLYVSLGFKVTESLFGYHKHIRRS